MIKPLLEILKGVMLAQPGDVAAGVKGLVDDAFALRNRRGAEQMEAALRAFEAEQQSRVSTRVASPRSDAEIHALVHATLSAIVRDEAAKREAANPWPAQLGDISVELQEVAQELVHEGIYNSVPFFRAHEDFAARICVRVGVIKAFAFIDRVVRE